MHQVVQQCAAAMHALQGQVAQDRQDELQRRQDRATEQLQESPLRQQVRSVVDPKVLERVRDFSGRDEDFPDWHLKMKRSGAVINMADEMQVAIDEPTERNL